MHKVAEGRICIFSGLSGSWPGVVEQVLPDPSQAGCEETSHQQCTCSTPRRMAFFAVPDLLHTQGADQALQLVVKCEEQVLGTGSWIWLSQ